ncbi:MAG TPA: UDP-N-acetylglucosamine 1-carboxyvinyltransferase [Candidatus Moranbacteria bacterium]|nr:MAG: UDP-N-acetylglucosamine 1-carboxyvinyltransferase [Candidatus Moranbacteria bacterium GW2011_GWC2_45_10]KKT95451.1 MAG: UDP-N-acetylglucosamine 1-carboxyvinyltransferase, UDP-N-acetylglucosamine 1-carboxyvinyltransferase [Parcubacteria group bacterium GW2011_GWC1_45_14]HAV11857.1 UDP-N-acetylglucosamine 1-carboxyvinyltransferase [Candidatus Moranbacteria bacterium]
MDYFVINGGKKLAGEIEVRGSKNAAAPIIAATLLTKEPCVLSNVPLIEDIFKLLEIIKSMGAEVEWVGERKVKITAKDLDVEKIDYELVKKIRLSVLLLGSLSARFDKFELANPGGCKIGKRPLGTHFHALEELGVKVTQDEKFYLVDASKRKDAQIILREFSVTATEIAMMLAAGMPGKTIIKIAAAEPHVEDLGKFLIRMGAKIKGLGTHTLEIEGTRKLDGAKHEIIPDANEAATFLIMGVATKSPIIVKNAREEHLDLVLEKLREMGAEFLVRKNEIQVIPAKKIKALSKIDARIYPGIPTDDQALFGVLATQAEGETLVFDTLFEGRFNYVTEIEKMGATVKVLNPHQAVFTGPTPLRGETITSYDLRAGASLILAALLAKGQSVIKEIYQVDRGYEKIEERLQKLGADIQRVPEGE